MIPTDIYLRLDYRSYKALEDQIRSFPECETVHTTVDGFYHKAIRFQVGDVVFEFQGPAVKEPIIEEVTEDVKHDEIWVPIGPCGAVGTHSTHSGHFYQRRGIEGGPTVWFWCGGYVP